MTSIGRFLSVGASLAFASLITVAHPSAAAAEPSQFKTNPPNCQNTNGPFDRWLAAFKQDAIQKGVRPQTVALALDGVQYAPDILRIDRGNYASRL